MAQLHQLDKHIKEWKSFEEISKLTKDDVLITTKLIEKEFNLTPINYLPIKDAGISVVYKQTNENKCVINFLDDGSIVAISGDKNFAIDFLDKSKLIPEITPFVKIVTSKK